MGFCGNKEYKKLAIEANKKAKTVVKARPKQENACCVWDYTIPYTSITCADLKKFCKEHAKAWVFQEEIGEGGYHHWQLRLSLKTKVRIPPKPVTGCKYTPTSEENYTNFFYVTKEDTRVEGTIPYSDRDKDIYIPRQYRGLMDRLYPWQEQILKSKDIFDCRIVNFVYDPVGSNGKTCVSALGELIKNGIMLPAVNDKKELMQIMADICIDTDNRTPGIVFIDMPRALDKTALNGIFACIEEIKNGKLYDMRYHYKSYWIDSPQIWVFSNIPPNLDFLSKDRWKCWTIEDGPTKVHGPTLKEFSGEDKSSVTLGKLKSKKRLL